MTPVPHRVVGRHTELADTVTLEVEPVAGPLPAAQPGQFGMLWAFGVGEVPISLSHCGPGGRGNRYTVRAVGATTGALSGLAEGETLGVRGPFGRGWDVDAARGRDVVVMAGGLGLAPLRPVVERILDRRDAFGRVAVLVGARSPDDILFADELAAWRRRGDVEVGVTVDHALGRWEGDVGVVTSLVPRLAVDAGTASAFVCGPEIMMRFAGAALGDRGVPADRIQVSLERAMACAVGHCGHCQLGPTFVCREGPVYRLDAVGPLLEVRAL